MNLILFEAAETLQPLPSNDRRALHIVEILRRKPGDSFDVGIINGPRGKATLQAIGPNSLTLTYSWESATTVAAETILLVGLPRPQTARSILRDATTLGVGALHFVLTARGEPNYAQSTLWTSGEWRRHVIAGAEQAFATGIPEVTHGRSLAAVLAALPAGGDRLALDNYESPEALGAGRTALLSPVVLAIGAERGWSPEERVLLRDHSFAFAHLGQRVLRTETAVTAALAILRARRGLM